MFWWIVLAVVVVLGAVAWWSSGPKRKGVDDASVQRNRKIDEGRGSQYGGGGGGYRTPVGAGNDVSLVPTALSNGRPASGRSSGVASPE